ncbi:MAG: DEAD/DEAH box helicase family protein, partial [Candidatus Bilamarchaeaceae archaeon]
MLRALQTAKNKTLFRKDEKPKLRKYQTAAIKEVLSNFHTYNKVVLSAAPSAGKTFMSLHIINNLLNEGTIKKALIIAHGQVVLKNQWIEEKPKIIDSEFLDSVQIEIAQNLNKIEGNPDFIVVDEAHQFYFANMIQTFLQKHPNTKCLLLTGTPSKFIYENDKAKLENKPIIYPITIVDAASILEQGYLSDLGVMAVSTKYDLDDSHFTESLDLNEAGLEVTAERAVEDFEIMMESMIKHLKMLGFFKQRVDRLTIQKLGKLAVPLFNVLHKTQIACASVAQAKKVYEWLKRNGVHAVLSEYGEDRDSDQIKKFVNDDAVRVLVVVNRAVLGFNLPHLVNVVDMTGSRNIDRIYQLLSRVTRKSDRYPNKFFFKLSNSINREVGAFYLEAALCLMFKEFVSKFNGKNLGGLKIPVEIKARKDK